MRASHSPGRLQLVHRWKQAVTDGIASDPIGKMAWTPEVIPFIPCPEEAEAACTFGGRVQHDILRLIRSGDFAEGANALISADIVKKWTKGTRETKERAVTLFLAYLRTVGAVSKFFPDGRQAPEDSCFHRR